MEKLQAKLPDITKTVKMIPGAVDGLLKAKSEITNGINSFGAVQSDKLRAQSLGLQEAQLKLRERRAKIDASEKINNRRRRLIRDSASANATLSSRGISTNSGTARQVQIARKRDATKDIKSALSDGEIRSAGFSLEAQKLRRRQQDLKKKSLLSSVKQLSRGIGALENIGQWGKLSK